MSDRKIKVLIVDDASFMVKALRDILETDEEIEVVGSARNGRDALEKIKALRPDVITLDVDMPVMDGIKAIRHIMIECPVPIVMLSSLFFHGDITFEALRLGVVDFLPKPSGAISTDIHSQGHQIIDRVKIAAAENIKNVHRVKLQKVDVRDQLAERYGFQVLDSVVALGTTLGGPNTIIRIMSEMPPTVSAAAVVVQEIEPKILPNFVKQFNEYTAWKVEAAQDGMQMEAGTCYVCSYKEPMVVAVNDNGDPCLRHANGEHKPLDGLFSSAAGVFEHNTVGVLLTGVGNDGQQGFGEIKRRSGVTIAQNTETCVYPNLARCAIEEGVVDQVVSDTELCRRIAAAVDALSHDDSAASA